MRTFAVLVWMSELALLRGQTSDKSGTKSLRSSSAVFVPRSLSNNLSPYYPGTKSSSQSRLPDVEENESRSNPADGARSVRRVTFSDTGAPAPAAGTQTVASTSSTKSQSAPKLKSVVDEVKSRSASTETVKNKSMTALSTSTSSSLSRRSIGNNVLASSSKSIRSASREAGSLANPLANFIHDAAAPVARDAQASTSRSSRSRSADLKSYPESPNEVCDSIQSNQSVTVPQSATSSTRGGSKTPKSFSIESKISELYDEFSKARGRSVHESSRTGGRKTDISERSRPSRETNDVNNVKLSRLLAARMGQLAGDEDVKKAADLLARMAGTAGTAAAFEFARQMENRQDNQRAPCAPY